MFMNPRPKLVLIFLPLSLSQTDTRSAAVLVDEFHAGGFERASNDIKRSAARLVCAGFELTNGHNANSGTSCKLLLAPIEESSGSPTLCCGDHSPGITQNIDSINSVEKRLTARIYRL